MLDARRGRNPGARRGNRARAGERRRSADRAGGAVAATPDAHGRGDLLDLRRERTAGSASSRSSRMTAPVHLALDALSSERRPRVADGIVERTLDAMARRRPVGRGAGRLLPLRHHARLAAAARGEAARDQRRAACGSTRRRRRVLDSDASSASAPPMLATHHGPARRSAGGYCGSEADTMLYADDQRDQRARRCWPRPRALLDDAALGQEPPSDSLERVLLRRYKPGRGDRALYGRSFARARPARRLQSPPSAPPRRAQASGRSPTR